MDRPEDMWAWAHHSPDDQPTPIDASAVLAVLVAHNAEQWLGRTLVGIARMDHQPGRLVAVDAGSLDGSRALLDKGVHDGLIHTVIDGDPEQGYGANVNLALAQAIADGFEPTMIWLLHDDSAPNRSALGELLLAATVTDDQGRRPAILVPKLLRPKRRNHPDQMSAVGESISPSGQRVPTVEPGDIDQHQQEPAQVLGASTAGLLVTREAWRQLGGLDPAIPLFRDGVDLGWRANAQGLLVRTCPTAALRHVEAGRVGLRESVLAPDSVQADQAAGMAVAVMHSRRPARTITRISAQSVVTAFGYLLGKSPSLAGSQLRAAAQLRRHKDDLVAAAASRESEATAAVPAGLLPGRGWGTRRFFDRLAGAVSDYYHDLTTEDDSGVLDELTGDDFAGGRQRARLWSPAVIGLLVMLIGCVIASRQLMHFGQLSGPALLPAPADLAQAWTNWTRSDPGMSGSNAPWLGFMALGSTLAFGQPDWFATLLVLGGPALAGWSAFHFLRGIAGPGWWTAVLACLWGALLPLTGATGQGSLDMSALAIALPLLGMAVRRWQTAAVTGADGLRAPAMVAVLIAVLCASMPWAWLLGVAIAVPMGRTRKDLRGMLTVVLGPLVLIAPWLPRLFADPGRLLTGSDPATRLAGNAPDAWDVLAGTTFLPGAPWPVGAVAIGLLWLVAVLGAVRARPADRPRAAVLLGGALVTAILAVLLPRVVITVARVPVRPDPTGLLFISLFALLALAALGIGPDPDRGVADPAGDQSAKPATARIRALPGAALAVSLCLAYAWWLIGSTSTLHRSSGVLPSYVTGAQESVRNTRALMVDLSSGIAEFNITSAANPSWGRAESPLLALNEQAADEILQVAEQFAQGQPSDDLATRLTELGIGHVWLRGAYPEAVAALGSAAQLSSAVHDEQTVVFTVTTNPSRAMLLDPAGENLRPMADGIVQQADPDTLIVLSSPADSDWHAEIDGQPLPDADSGDWRQAWATQGRTGELRYWLGADVVAVGWQALALIALLVLAAPTIQRAHAPRRALKADQGSSGGQGR